MSTQEQSLEMAEALASLNQQLGVALQQHAIAIEALRHSEATFRHFLDNSMDAFLMTNETGGILMANSVACQMFGYSEYELMQGGYALLVDSHDPTIEAMKAQIRSTGESRAEVRMRRRDGSTFPAETASRRYEDDDGARKISVTIRDISERKQLEADRFEHALENEHMRLLADFIQRTSHDLRTPLTIIATNAHLLRRITDPDTRERKVKGIEDQVARLTSLINELFEMSQIDRVKRLELRRLEINSLIRNLVERLETRLSTKGLKCTLKLHTPLPTIDADEGQLGRALYNLLENAILYTPDGGDITMETTYTSHHVVISLRDTGIGISDDDLPHIFERFFKADRARQAGLGGVGLGLPIARKILERHGGRIEVESRLGSGSLFRVYLPMTIEPPAS
ncbi:MAG: PAS domain S-box protein [Anaerolineae bacterium]|nr:PAS domain S-box protein [Anaerolineae bacterium]